MTKYGEFVELADIENAPTADVVELEGSKVGKYLSYTTTGNPTADVPDRKVGKWVKVGHFGRTYKCNRCGNYLDFDGVNAGRGDANFCPNCGARMEGYDAEVH